MISNPFTDPKWAKKTVASIDRWVDFISDKTTRPIANLVRLVVFGVIAVVATVTIVVLALIGISRALNELLDIWLTRQNAVWISYFILSFVFVAIGAWLMRKRYPNKQN
ncbi:MAG: hypothetical protein NWS60_03120 [Ilumatobacteraceae bacterium]|nr:MAG: hypothetical protein ABR56_09875 [Acidimicrobium sp. BACL27 MAG-120823-bin4]MDA2963846.1 hypothetical protein [Actinomycetota bacterium]MDP4635252.1 hypothetical protein [Ilumatobacteraceae bacterium]HBZ62000.1 hypothetical protein [Acidimicrobium sp.]MDA2982622.1 hypothetical protein [Actinomycetota bacterium]